ncbi:YSIRK-type signal peptide-containing protein [Helcococcus ovis]|uniref:YSIRK-type signal peptide-containing protein n=1 Tax=Helcococcus ovis TaxID=72026 RepID=UPI001070686E|nr:YSIRK-type signal peptide-containing protein [Helcococcus ovis]TFF66590.1 YSIRK-type signal peptide-containing protein [Helcococcus ovis]WNZ00827.1 YSIRK-type signal peptide-containing protein [Helcococcus ovis]
MKGKNNQNRILRYSIRKLSIGVVSVVVGAFTILGVSNIYGADFSNGAVAYAQDIWNEPDQAPKVTWKKLKAIQEVRKLKELSREEQNNYIGKIRELKLKELDKLQEEINKISEEAKKENTQRNELSKKVEEKLEELRDYVEQVRDSYKMSSRFGAEYFDVVSKLTEKLKDLEREVEAKQRDIRNSHDAGEIKKKHEELKKIAEKVEKAESEMHNIVEANNTKYQVNNKIDKLEYLSERKKNDYKAVLTDDNAESNKVVSEIAEERNNKNKEAFDKIKSLKYLSKKQKDDYKVVLIDSDTDDSLDIALDIAKEKNESEKKRINEELSGLSDAWTKTDKKGEREQNRQRLLKEAKEREKAHRQAERERLLKEAKEREKAHRQAERERLLKEAKEKEKRAKINKDLEGLSDAWKKEDLEGRKSQLDKIRQQKPGNTKIKPHLLTEESVKYVKGSMKDVVIKTDAEISSFVEVRVGGKVLDPSNYEVKDGSTMVTLKNSYLETLPLGKYVVEVVSKETDKYYSSILKTTLTVVENKDSNNKPEVKPQPQQKPSENKQNPETGDLGVITSVVTALAAGAALVATRKKDE